MDEQLTKVNDICKTDLESLVNKVCSWGTRQVAYVIPREVLYIRTWETVNPVIVLTSAFWGLVVGAG